MTWMCRAQDIVGRCRQSRLPAFDAGAMNKEKGRHSMPHNERCRKPDSIGRNYQERGGYIIAAQQTKQERQM